MKKLLILIALLVSILTLWNCTSQSEIIEEEEIQEEVLLGRSEFSTIDDTNIDDTKIKSTIVVDCDDNYYTIEVTYANHVPLSRVIELRGLLVGDWHLDYTWTEQSFTETGYINQIHDVWSVYLYCMQVDPITGECTLCPQTTANILVSTEALSGEEDVELVE